MNSLTCNFKVLLLTRLYPPDVGGVPKYYSNLIKLLTLPITVVTRKENHFFTQCTSSSTNVIRPCALPDNLALTVTVKYSILLANFIYWLFKQFLFQRKQIIPIVGQARFFFLFPCWLAKKILGIDYIVWLHGEEIPIPEKMTKSQRFEKLFLKDSVFVICNSEFTKKRFNRLLPHYDREIIICTPGVEDMFLDYSPTDSQRERVVRDRHKLHGKKVIYTIARLDKRKGHDKMLEALPFIIQKFPEVMYVIGGKGPEEERLRLLTRRYNVVEHVEFAGMVKWEEMVAYHHVGNVFSMPNRTLDDGDTEGFGIVFLEANAVGNPVIAGKAGGAPDAVCHGETGFLVDPEDPDDIAEKICLLLGSPDTARKFGDRGRERASQKYRWPVIAEKFERELVMLMNNYFNC